MEGKKMIKQNEGKSREEGEERLSSRKAKLHIDAPKIQRILLRLGY